MLIYRMDSLIKKLHFKFHKYIFSRPYPFDQWLILLTAYAQLWLYSLFFSPILSFIFDTSIISYLKFYFVFNFFAIIYIIFKSYKLTEFIKLVYQTIDQLFRMTIGRLIGFKPIDYEYKPITERKYFGKNILNFNEEKCKVFEKKYEHIDFLVLNDYITIEEGNKRTDELLKKEYGYGFLVTLGGHYYSHSID